MRILCVFVIMGFLGTARAQILQDELEPLLARSLFTGPIPPASSVAPNTPYDPILLSVVSSLKSRSPRPDRGRWQIVRLAPFPNSECSGPITAHVWHAKKEGSDTFVIFPGSFATFKRGSFTNLTMHHLFQIFGDVNIVTFAGFLTPEFLRGACRTLPWDTHSLAVDIYRRLSRSLAPLFVKGKNGTVGFSGGANIAAGLLAADGAEDFPLFGRGGIAVSPILHARTAFETLDSQYEQGLLPHWQDFLSADRKNIWSFLRLGGKLGWEDLGVLYGADPVSFSSRFYNQFRHDLAEARQAVARRKIRDQSFYQTFVGETFSFKTKSNREITDPNFDAATEWRPWLTQIKRPMLIYFSQDDPVLSASVHADQSEDATRVLLEASKNPFVAVFNPKYGGHTGALLDPIFADLIHAVFNAGIQQ